MSQLKISAALRAKLEARGYFITGYQPRGWFRPGPRKLDRVPEPGDPWSVTIRRKSFASWADGSLVGHGRGDTPDAAAEAALGGGDVRGAMSRLGEALDALVAALRA